MTNPTDNPSRRMRTRIQSLSSEALQPLREFDARVSSFLDQQTDTFVTEHYKPVLQAFKTAFHTAFTSGIITASIPNVKTLDEKIKASKEGVSFQLGQLFRGDQRLPADTKAQLTGLYAEFMDGVRAEIQSQLDVARGVTR